MVKDRKRRLYTYQMVGYDILVDTDMNVYLLEINNTPSLAPHTTLENAIKKTMIHDMYSLVDVTNSDYDKLDELFDKYWPRVRQLAEQRAVIRGFHFEAFRNSDDLKAVIETLLENERRGHFERAFPNPGDFNYLKFVTNPRNHLVVSWLSSGLSLEDILMSAQHQKHEDL